MKKLTDITDNPKQEMSVLLDDGKMVIIRLYYIESQIGWFFDVEYEGIVSTCHRVTNSPNIMREKINIYPFGIGCSVTDGQEPWFINDFSVGRASLYVLSKEDVKYMETNIYGKIF